MGRLSKQERTLVDALKGVSPENMQACIQLIAEMNEDERMSRFTNTDQLIELAEAQGWVTRQSHAGVICCPPDKNQPQVTISRHNANKRDILNSLSWLRRSGFNPDFVKPPKVEKPKTVMAAALQAAQQKKPEVTPEFRKAAEIEAKTPITLGRAADGPTSIHRLAEPISVAITPEPKEQPVSGLAIVKARYVIEDAIVELEAHQIEEALRDYLEKKGTSRPPASAKMKFKLDRTHFELNAGDKCEITWQQKTEIVS